MPQYQFNLIDSRTVADESGAVLEDDIAAADVAYRFAAELSKVRPELRGKGYAILVTNANGEEVHRAPTLIRRRSLARRSPPERRRGMTIRRHRDTQEGRCMAPMVTLQHGGRR